MFCIGKFDIFFKKTILENEHNTLFLDSRCQTAITGEQSKMSKPDVRITGEGDKKSDMIGQGGGGGN